MDARIDVELARNEAPVSGITKFIFKSLKSPSNGHRRAIKTTRFLGSLKLFYVRK